MNPGAAPTPALSGRVTRRTAWIAAGAALVALGAWALLVRALLATDDDPGIPPVEVLVGALYFGGPYALAAATAVVAASRVAVGVDAPARLVALATSGRRGRRDEWGAAMRAELASITASRRERLRFAAGCALTALRRGGGRSPWIVAAACAALFAALTVATSRASLDGSRTGSLWGVIYGPPQITLLVVGLVAAWTGRSMRTGLEHAIAALAGILVGVLAAAIPEGAVVGPRGRRVPTRWRCPVHAPYRRRGRARRAEGDDADLGPPALAALARARRGRRRSAPSEIHQLGRTNAGWRHQIAAWHQAFVTNGPTEAAKNLIKRVGRVEFGFRRFADYRIRVLLYAGRPSWDLRATVTPAESEEPHNRQGDCDGVVYAICRRRSPGSARQIR